MFESPAPIATVTAHLRTADRAMHDAVEHLLRSREAVVAESGLSMAVWLAAVSRLPKAERTRLLVAVDVLPSLPGVRARFARGVVSWPVVSRICGRAARLTADEAAIVDQRMCTAIDQLAGDWTADAILEVLWETVRPAARFPRKGP